MELHPFVEEVLVSQEQLANRVAELGRQISKDYASANQLVVVCVLKGAFVFCADLIRAISGVPVRSEFLKVSSYGVSTESSGTVRIDLDLKQDIENAHVLIVEDIIDTGLTLSHLLELLSLRKPASLNVCAMLRKPTQAKVKVDAKYVGFDIPPKFVVGVGLDWSEKLRELPYIGVLKEEMYKQ